MNGRADLYRPVLSLKNTELLVSWYEGVVAGGDHPPPPESEVFRSDNYSNFIYLFFKIGTEVNVFAHLGKVLFTQMKERGGHILYILMHILQYL